MNKPNVIFIMTDQQRQDTLGCYGNRAVKTPSLDKLAEEGALFDHFYVNNPVCVPSRCSFLTGRYPNSHRSRDLEYALDTSEQHLFKIMKEAGYRLGLSGKNHALSQSELKCFEMVDLHRHKKTELMDKNKVYGSAVDPISAEQYTTRLIGKSSIQFIQDSIQESEPFCLWVSFPDPHTPVQVPEPYASMADRDQITMPIEPELSSDKPLSQRVLHEIQGVSNASQEEMVQLKALYYGMIAFIDEVVGDMMETLRRLEAEENTIIIFTSDHGDYLGDYGLVRKSWNFYDCLLRVPFILTWKGKITPQRFSQTMAESVDLLPTLLHLLKIPIPDQVQGDSFVPLLKGKVSSHKQVVFAEAGNPGDSHIMSVDEWKKKNQNNPSGALWSISAVQGSMVRTMEWKLSQYMNGEGELYNVRKDPDEINNLYGHAQHMKKQLEMTQLLAMTMMENQDHRKSDGDLMGAGNG